MLKKVLEKLFIFGMPESSLSFTETDTIERLKTGNYYFTSYMLAKPHGVNIERVRYLAVNGQAPRAVIITCSDARISPERIFNAEMGDFFIIRTAGNVVGDLELGSVEYAVSSVGTDTVVVMGHENCGAIHSAIHSQENQPGCVSNIIDIIRPSVAKAFSETSNKTAAASKAEDYNIFNSLEKIKSSPIIKKLMEEGKLRVVGAKYGIATGKVTFFE